MSAKILVLDLETSPNLAYVWGLFNQNIALNQLREVGQVISFAARWHGSKTIEFVADYNYETQTLDNHPEMVVAAYDLIDAADMVVHWNGTSFDMPHLHREFVLQGLTPPSPYKNVDLLHTSRKQFRFVSNKLDHVASQLGVGHKAGTGGFDLWRRCMAGDHQAWLTMRKYNRRDVEVTDGVYNVMKPWITSHPHVGLYGDTDKPQCGRCGGKVQKRGYATTLLGIFPRFHCQKCGGWSRGGKRVAGVDVRPAS